MISSVFATVVSAGFSMITCLPASRASMATSPCRPVGVQTDDDVDVHGLPVHPSGR